jgi:serine O-acetyltransferase
LIHSLLVALCGDFRVFSARVEMVRLVWPFQDVSQPFLALNRLPAIMYKLNLLDQLIKYISLFGEITSEEVDSIDRHLSDVVSDSQKCFSSYKNLPRKFNFFQTHHSIYFIYKLANKLHMEGQGEISEKLYLVNRLINGVDLFYKINMPQYFIAAHGLGTVFSRAKYGEYFVVYQNSTIGISGGQYPTIKNKVVIFANCVIAGNTTIGENCVISAGTTLINKNIPDNSIVYGCGGSNIIIKNNNKNVINEFFEI